MVNKKTVSVLNAMVFSLSYLSVILLLDSKDELFCVESVMPVALFFVIPMMIIGLLTYKYPLIK